MTPQPRSAKTRALILAGVMLLGFGAAWTVYRFQPRFAAPPAARDTWATVLHPARDLPEFELLDHHGKALTKSSLRGHWTYLFFGYTHCPDVCPTTLAALAGMDKLMAGKVAPADRPEVLFVSVDPARDTPETLARYVPYFNPRFVGATGSPAQLRTLAKPLGIDFSKAPAASADDYAVDHGSSLLLINPRARLQAVSSPPHRAATLFKDYRKIIAHPR